MSLQTFLQTVETDLIDAFHVVETDAETALLDIWGVAKPLFTSFEPTLVKDVLTAVTAFLSSAEQAVIGGNFADIEQAFLMDLESAGSALLKDATGLGSNLLQVLIGLAKGALKL